jgi:hypothetical protein
MYRDLHGSYTLVLSDFYENSILSIGLWKILKYQISWKSVQWKPTLSIKIHRQTDIMNLIVDFRNFVEVTKGTFPVMDFYITYIWFLLKIILWFSLQFMQTCLPHMTALRNSFCNLWPLACRPFRTPLHLLPVMIPTGNCALYYRGQ